MKDGLSFLLIDDDVEDQELFSAAMENINGTITCITAVTGEEGLKLLNDISRKLPDLIFLDLNMPRMTGKECLVEIKKNNRLKNIPVVIYSTSSNMSDKLETAALGAIDFITKPGHFSELIEVLHTCISRQGLA